MEMCYDGALVMPRSYAVMNEEEMTYVEGGFYINKDKCATMATYISMITGVSQYALTVMSLGTLAAHLAGKAMPIANKLTGLSITAKIMGVVLVSVVALEFASFCNGILTADRLGTGVSMQWKGVFTNKKYS